MQENHSLPFDRVKRSLPSVELDIDINSKAEPDIDINSKAEPDIVINPNMDPLLDDEGNPTLYGLLKTLSFARRMSIDPSIIDRPIFKNDASLNKIHD